MADTQIKRNSYVWTGVVIILLVTLMPGNGKIAGDYLDKIVHFGIFFFLSVNICYKYDKNKQLTEAVFWTIFFGLITEVLQQFIPGRNMDLYDGIADTLGVIVGYYFYKKKYLKVDK